MTWKKTQYPGIRYREHKTRMHGRQPDRYFNARFMVAGVSVNEGYGWASEGMTAKKAFLLMSELKEELRAGKGTGKLADRRKALQEEQEAARREELKQARLATTYDEYFNENYLPTIQGKKGSTKAGEITQHKRWIIPAIGKVPIREIMPLHVEKVFRKMFRAGKTLRTIQHALGCMRMVISSATIEGFFEGVNPVDAWKRKNRNRLKFDNKRTRFFSHEEAETLLDTLKKRSLPAHNMTLLSLHCGLRAGEIFNLTWGDVDLVHGLITLRNTKSGKTRTVHMTKAVQEMFSGLEQGKKTSLVFPDRKGRKRKQMSKTFNRVVAELGFNDEVEDPRQKVLFHTCRHTCASWLVMSGVPLYQVKDILGHSTIAMTERYAHLAPDGAKAAMNLMEQAIENSRKVVNIQSVQAR